ncbi:conserved hypothetical protein [Xenorhabdus nematophila ATCC 19061]|uniref:DUF4276 family protein n=1 Tax=Xenorhabdus nematophila (strain ATCC 19061 / DSM 3370 / CCUG 14189 / LMG 1036 / NCIMB 9965 / AN6) TaxID=406817 RepID=D3V9Z7_XENNA|nr:DUF4276 family protein [Xenorhabdus nematophila]CBJ91561.1 conserved hypothetical protein [Xenorhabdus nematophila ATCC 19061]CEK24387.1 conserved hypothetical protein [Xenorhabdus nematophila AN6/1]
MSNYIEVIAIVEGKTEQIFFEKILQPYLAEKMISIYATQVSKPGQKGGDVRFSRVRKDIEMHLKQRSTTYVTTFIDYYGTNEWPGLETLNKHWEPKQIAEHLYQSTQNEIRQLLSGQRVDERFIPYIVMHEFEALLFSDKEVLANELNIDVQEVERVLRECGEPEYINNSPQTAPSKRLGRWSAHGRFAKTTAGIAIAEKIGIPKMREQCPLFDEWLCKLEILITV